MDDKYWLNKWQSDDIAFHEKFINANLIAYIDELKLPPRGSILVPLCGKSKDMLWLADRGFHVVGIELSPIACKDFFAELNITPNITTQTKFIRYHYQNIELLCGNLFDLTPADLPGIQAVYDCKALIALPSDLRKGYLDHIVACLGKNIRILLLTRETNCKVNPPPFPINKAEVDSLYGPYFEVKELKRDLVKDVPERLIRKGYTEMTESVYLIIPHG